MALGLRLLALAVVSGAAAFLEQPLIPQPAFLAGIAAGALLAWADAALQRGRRRGALLLVPGHLAVWLFLVHAAGGPGTPVTIGLLLEVPLSTITHGRRGLSLAVAGGALGYAGYLAVVGGTSGPFAWAAVFGFLGLSGAVTWFVLRRLEVQQAAIAAYQGALARRGRTLAEELRLLGEYLSGALLTIDDRGRVVRLNRAAVGVLGLDGMAWSGRPWQEVLRPDRQGAARIARTLEEGVPQKGVPLLVGGRDGSLVAATAECWVVPSPRGRRTFILLDPREGVRHPDDPLRRLGQATSHVAHQIRNSTHALQTFAHELESELAPDSGPRRSLEHLVKALRALAGLAGDVLEFARPTPETRVEAVPLGEAISSAVLLAARDGQRIEVAGDNGGFYAWGSRCALVHALFNLFDNACRATAPDGHVRVRVGKQADALVFIDVIGEGPATAAAGRVDAMPGVESGHGLGLEVARRFVDACGGSLTLHAEPGGGTRSRILLRDAPPRASQTGALPGPEAACTS